MQCYDVIQSKIKQMEKFTLEEREMLKTSVLESVRYLRQSQIISKDIAIEMLTFLDAIERIAIRTTIFTKIVDNAFATDLETVNILMSGYKEDMFSYLIIGDLPLEVLEQNNDNPVEKHSIKTAMHGIISDYIYALGVKDTIEKAGAFSWLNYELLMEKDEKRYRNDADERITAFMDIRESFFTSSLEFDRLIITNSISKMGKLMHNTNENQIDVFEFIQIMAIYTTSLSLMDCLYQPYSKNFASMDLFKAGLKELIISA